MIAFLCPALNLHLILPLVIVVKGLLADRPFCVCFIAPLLIISKIHIDAVFFF